MSYSEINICNSALIRLGANTISSFSDGTVESNACDEMFEKSRDIVLANHPWNFAIKRSSMAALSSTPTWGWDHQYQLPSDCLRVLDTRYDTTKYVIEGGKLLSNYGSPFEIKYIAQITTTGSFSPNFVEVLEKRLAWDLSFLLVQSVSTRTELRNEYLLALADARSFDAQEGYPESAITDTFLDARISGVSYED